MSLGESEPDESVGEVIGGAVFEKLLSECQAEFSIPKRKHAVKSPTVIGAVIERARKEGKTSKTLENIVRNILALADISAEIKAVT